MSARGALAKARTSISFHRPSQGQAFILEHHLAVADRQFEHFERISPSRIHIVLAVYNLLAGLVHHADGFLLVCPCLRPAHANCPVPVRADHDFLGYRAGFGELGFDADGQLLPGVGMDELVEEARVHSHPHAHSYADARKQDMRELVVDIHGVSAERRIDASAELDGQLQGHQVIYAGIARLPFQPHSAAGRLEDIHPEIQHLIPGFLKLHRRARGIVHLACCPCRPPDADASSQACLLQFLRAFNGLDMQISGHFAVVWNLANHAATFGAREPELGSRECDPFRIFAGADSRLEPVEAYGVRRVVFTIRPAVRVHFVQDMPGATQFLIAFQPEFPAEFLDGQQAFGHFRNASGNDIPAELGITCP